MSSSVEHSQRRHLYVECSMSNYHRNIESNLRWRLCVRIGLGLAVIICCIFIPLIVIGATQKRLHFNVTEVEVGLRSIRPLLHLSFPIQERTTNHQIQSNSTTIKQELVYTCMKEAQAEFNNRKDLEKQLFHHQLNRTDQTPFSYHQQITTLNPETRNISDSAVLAEISVRLLLEKEQLVVEDLHFVDATPLLKQWVHCELSKKNKNTSCQTSLKFRTLDGSCNNFHHPRRGSSLQTFRRILPAVYDDGFSSPRTKSVIPHVSLPSARKVSQSFTYSAAPIVIEHKLNMLFLTWGQFLDHDMTNTASTKGVNGSAISCCSQCRECRNLHPQCFPILVDKTDSFYGDKGVRCLDFVRSAPAPQCSINKREQFNQASAYIDGSMIYATTRLEGDVRLRAHVNGNLRGKLHHDGRWMLPISVEPKDGCNRDEFIKQNRYCFKAGDGRVNEQIGLTAMHTIWMREHNRIANTLAEYNRHWDDERIYEETRRIVIAQLQHITYNEFVPLLLGEELTEQLKLRPLESGYDNSYNKEIDAGVSNEFSTAAYRFGHSMLQGLVEFHGGRSNDYAQLTKILFNPFALWDFGKLDAVVRGSVQQCPRKVDTSFSIQVTNHLFQPNNSNHGLDLFAINVQRGRDHGLAPYFQWRPLCNLSPMTDWNDIEREMRSTSFAVLKQIYRDIKDVDLYVGILSENPLADGILGPVGSCIIADQLMRSKIGDRFWYETNDVNIRFTSDQLNEIRKTSLARIMCNNGDALSAIQLRSMEIPSDSNPIKRCAGDEIPRIDLSFWEEL